MKRLTFLFLIVPVLIFAQQKITLEDIWVKYAFYPKSAQGFNVLKDGLTYADIDQGPDGAETLYKYEIKTQKKLGLMVSGIDLKFGEKMLDIKSYEFSPNEDKLLVSEATEYVYRRPPSHS